MTARIPYAVSLGAEQTDAGWRLAYTPNLIGAPERLHGGALAGFLEVVAISLLRNSAGHDATLKPVSVTVDFLRAASLRDVWASAEITRLGRRVANVRAIAWQDGPDKPVATAHLNVLIVRASETP
jgi:acyl-coenzyme A thioesterase PaaI-like protein